MIRIVEASSDIEFELAGQLFQEYARQLGFDLSFQDFGNELREMKQQYSRPNGMVAIAYNDENQPIGCFGIRHFEHSICELKRMYIKKTFRGLGFGKQLISRAVQFGTELGYKKMRLDTIPSMEAAIHLYENLGFYEIDAYRFNPIVGTRYYELQL